MLEQELNEIYGFEGKLSFSCGQNKQVFATLENELATCEVYLHGAHVTRLNLAGEEILWMSPLAVFDGNKAIRGGIPICWPWFGPHPTHSNLPSHGFARNSLWDVVEANTTTASTQLILGLNDSPQIMQSWEHAFDLRLSLELTDCLTLELSATNLSDKKLTVGGALHSYFAVSQIESAKLQGLDGTHYLDQLDGHQQKLQNGVVQFQEEVDRVYRDPNTSLRLSDSRRCIEISKTGSESTVVWNPWIEKAKTMSDFPDQAYQEMVCVETANAFDDQRELEPGETHSLVKRFA